MKLTSQQVARSQPPRVLKHAIGKPWSFVMPNGSGQDGVRL
jgi:hypothetical protein